MDCERLGTELLLELDRLSIPDVEVRPEVLATLQANFADCSWQALKDYDEEIDR